jgi:hypothetical protein
VMHPPVVDPTDLALDEAGAHQHDADTIGQGLGPERPAALLMAYADAPGVGT